MKIKIHMDAFKWVTPTIDVPTIDSPYRDFPEWMQHSVMHKLDTNKRRWWGCWMYKGVRDARGEPYFKNKDPVRVNGVQWTPKNIFYKSRIALEFVELSRLMPRRDSGMPLWNVLHLCGNLDCLNPSHFLICLDHHTNREKEVLRDTYLAPGSYHVPGVK